jgi:hypothetical protein
MLGGVADRVRGPYHYKLGGTAAFAHARSIVHSCTAQSHLEGVIAT